MFNDERHMEKLSMLLYWHQHISITWVRCNLTSVLFLKRGFFLDVYTLNLSIAHVTSLHMSLVFEGLETISSHYMCTFFLLILQGYIYNIQKVSTSLYNICSSYQLMHLFNI